MIAGTWHSCSWDLPSQMESGCSHGFMQRCFTQGSPPSPRRLSIFAWCSLPVSFCSSNPSAIPGLVSPHLLSAPASCEVGPWVVALQWKHEWSRVCSGCTCWREARNMKLEQLVLLCTSEAQFLFKSCVKSLSKFCFGQKFCLILKTTPYKKNKKTFNWLLLST